jgi:succinoglycan biosynthesis transport protein ExoP
MSHPQIPSQLPVPSRAGGPHGPGMDLTVPSDGWAPQTPFAMGDGEPRTPWHRYLAALRRFRWLVIACVVLGVAGGFVTTRFVLPEYEVHGTIWISQSDERRQTAGSPIQAEQLLNSGTWEQLFTSLRVTDSVVRKRRRYLHYPPNGQMAFLGFDVGPSYKPGTYELAVTPANNQYTLSVVGREVIVSERGQIGDSIGRQLGFKWRPSPAALRQLPPIRFSVDPIHQASQSLVDRSTAALPDNSQFMKVSLVSDHGYEGSANLNEWMSQFVAVAADLKRRKVVEITSILGTQLQYADTRLKSAEQSLEAYETGTATRDAVVAAHADAASGAISSATGGGLGAAPLATAVGAGQNPMLANYFTNQVQRDNLRQDIARVQAILADAGTPQFNPEDLLAVPTLMLNADNLNNAIKTYSTKQNELRDLRLKYTDEYKPVRDLETSVATMQLQTIPQLARQALARMQSSESAITQRVTTQSRDITQLPKAEVEVMRLRREVDQAALLYNTLQARYEEARLAGESAIPDVQILDRPVAPSTPTRNTKPRIMFMALMGGLGVGLALAILIDRLDRRVRYPEQATDELGLPIIGTVPMVRGGEREVADEEASQVVEAFRTIRLNILTLFDPNAPVVFTITSPGAGEGKSLISSNLAMSFAESGRRTLLIDGDIRRGQLHSAFGIHQAPGVLDYLTGHASLEEVLQVTDYENLTVVSCGARRHRGPELLASERMLQFLNSLRPHFDTIIVDSPPLGAGIDPFALGAATGNLMVVLRVGRSDRQMAQAKLGIVDRYPIRVLGCVLNDVKAEGAFRYYSYLYGYTLDDSERQAQLPSKVGEVGAREEVSG